MEKIAFLFPGQGSQKVGMGRSFLANSKVSQLYEQCSEVAGFDLKRLLLEGPKDQLCKTAKAQPAIVTDSVARFRLLKAEGIDPDFLVGHSLGEFSALVAANSLSFTQGIKLVEKRGELMGDITVKGSMVAVLGLDYRKVEDLVGRQGEEVVVANYNSPTQTVISGRKDQLDKSCDALKEMGGKCIWLDVTGPFHSPYMEEAENELAKHIDNIPFRDPRVPVLSGVSGSLETKGAKLKKLLTRQMTHPVRWIDYIRLLGDLGVGMAIEVGHSGTLCKLTKKILPELEVKRFDEVI